MLFEVTLKSKDDNTFLFTTEADSEELANKKAINKIEELGWDNFSYKIFRTKRIENANTRTTKSPILLKDVLLQSKASKGASLSTSLAPLGKLRVAPKHKWHYLYMRFFGEDSRSTRLI